MNTSPRNEYRLDQVYAAIANPTRRAILAMLAGGDANVGHVAALFPLSFNGVSKHVKALERAGLVERIIHGREHRLHLRAAPLHHASRWLDHYSGFWDSRLDALESFLAESEHPRASRSRPESRQG